MNRTEFETELQRDGYELVDRTMDANHVNPEHSHEFDARLLMLAGEMTITRAGAARTYRAGDTCVIAACTLHTEHCGPAGAHYLAGRRYK
jgi:quercetin dioxygenase-like cupin family protein